MAPEQVVGKRSRYLQDQSIGRQALTFASVLDFGRRWSRFLSEVRASEEGQARAGRKVRESAKESGHWSEPSTEPQALQASLLLASVPAQHCHTQLSADCLDRLVTLAAIRFVYSRTTREPSSSVLGADLDEPLPFESAR